MALDETVESADASKGQPVDHPIKAEEENIGERLRDLEITNRVLQRVQGSHWSERIERNKEELEKLRSKLPRPEEHTPKASR